MALPFVCLPDSTANAPTNMARDLLLLENFSQPEAMRFRHYAWEDPCCTFGYSQQWAWVQAQAQAAPAPGLTHPLELVRRPTGGGVVDHRNDWTYALVIPSTHPRCRGNAAATYQIVHEALATAMEALGCPAESCPCERIQCGTKGPGLCFAAPEPFDVVRRGTLVKLAGAAQKRNRHGLLLQGSVDKAVSGKLDWANLREAFIEQLAKKLETAAPSEHPHPALAEEETLAKRFASQEWNQRR